MGRLRQSSQVLSEVVHVLVVTEPLTQADSKALKDYGVHGKTRLLVMRTAKAAASAKLADQEVRAQRLARLKEAASAVAARGDGRCHAVLMLCHRLSHHMLGKMQVAHGSVALRQGCHAAAHGMTTPSNLP